MLSSEDKRRTKMDNGSHWNIAHFCKTAKNSFVLFNFCITQKKKNCFQTYSVASGSSTSFYYAEFRTCATWPSCRLLPLCLVIWRHQQFIVSCALHTFTPSSLESKPIIHLFCFVLKNVDCFVLFWSGVWVKPGDNQVFSRRRCPMTELTEARK